MIASCARRPYRAGVAVVALAALLIVWTTIVRDDGHGEGFFLIIMAAMVGAAAAEARSAGMARTMLGVAIMQILFGIAQATAPVIAAVPGGSARALIAAGAFAALWLLSAVLFRIAAAREPGVIA